MSHFRWSFGAVVDQEAQQLDRALRDRFEIGALLGKGGMGQVFRARDRLAGRSVALKLLHDTPNEAQRLRFDREGKLTAALEHPGIVRVHGGGTTERGEAFLVLELVEDASPFSDHLHVDLERSLDLLIQVARAVGYAHARGVVHRDLKPENVLIDGSGRAKVCDFGLAWRADVEQLTRTGQLLGTPLYMAPERFGSSARLEVRPAADVWSLGVLLYEALAGVHPFQAGTLVELMASVSRATPKAPSELSPRATRALDAVCLRALAREPADRFADGDAFADALELAALRTRPGLPWRSVGVALAGTALALLALVTTWVGAPPQFEPAGRVTEEAAAPGPPSPPPPPRSPPPASVTDPARARLLLAEAKRRAREPVPLDEGVLADFDAARRLAGEGELADRIDVARLDYLFRRGRWEQLSEEGTRLGRLGGALGAEATLIHGLSLNELLRRDDAKAVLAAHWERSESRTRSATDFAVGAWERSVSKDPAEAIRRAEAALALAPDHFYALLAKAASHGQVYDMKGVERAVRPLFDRVPDHPTVLRFLGLVAAQRNDDELACAHYARMVELFEPAPPTIALTDYAQVLANGGRLVEARVVLERALKADPTDGNARFMFGYVLVRLGYEAKGAYELNTARRDDPEEFANQLGLLPERVGGRLTELMDLHR